MVNECIDMYICGKCACVIKQERGARFGVHGMFTERAWNVHGMFTERAWNVNGMFSECAWNVHGTRMEYVHGIRKECTWNIMRMGLRQFS